MSSLGQFFLGKITISYAGTYQILMKRTSVQWVYRSKNPPPPTKKSRFFVKKGDEYAIYNGTNGIRTSAADGSHK